MDATWGRRADERHHLNSMLGHTLAVLEYARRIYEDMGFEGAVDAIVSFLRMRGVPIYAFPKGFPEAVGVSRFDDAVRFDISVSTERMRAARDAVGADVLHASLFALGWADAGRAGAEAPLTEQLLASAYDYNSWQRAQRQRT